MIRFPGERVAFYRLPLVLLRASVLSRASVQASEIVFGATEPATD